MIEIMFISTCFDVMCSCCVESFIISSTIFFNWVHLSSL